MQLAVPSALPPGRHADPHGGAVLPRSPPPRPRSRDERPIADQPFHGMLVRDHAETGGLLVGWILPGPLGGTG
ncbi:MAG: hypothetical protein M5U09_05365, partial [Gammaproteobacteria bacterium]|nr:hypothetical protein [Gammaproteobacteria bacterium]